MEGPLNARQSIKKELNLKRYIVKSHNESYEAIVPLKKIRVQDQSGSGKYLWHLGNSTTSKISCTEPFSLRKDS